MFKALILNNYYLARSLHIMKIDFVNKDGSTDMTMKLYLTGATLWLIALAQIADFNPFANMTDLAGQLLTF